MMGLINFIAVKPYRTLAIFFGICVALYIAMIPIPRASNLLIGSDGVRYYMWVRSLVIDHDLHFANEYAHFSNYTKFFFLDPLVQTPTGYIANKSFIGPGVLWAPFFITAHIISLALNNVGFNINTDGYTYIYQAAICLGSIVYGFLGILFIFDITKKFYPKTALATCFIILFATNAIYYMLFEPSMPHMCSLFAVALLIKMWIDFRPMRNYRRWFLVGLAGGLVGIVRQPDATYLLLPLLDGLLDRETTVVTKIKSSVILITGFFLVYALQMANWTIIYGTPFTDGYSYNGEFFAWFSPKIFGVLFSNPQGLFFLHPILLFGLFGLFFLYRRDRILTILIVLGFSLQVYIIGSFYIWAGVAFGGRMFIASFPILAIGIAAFLDWQSEKKIKPFVWVTCIILIGWNVLFVIQYRLAYIPHFGALTFEQIFIDKFRMIGILGYKVYEFFISNFCT
jgi:hypothetical protein